MSLRIARVMLAAMVLVVAVEQTLAQRPVYFRHDHGVAVDDASPLPAELDAAKALWKRPLPPGHSTPMVVGQRLLLTSADANSKELITLCLDLKSGEELWRQSIRVPAFEKTHAEGGPAAASVASDGRRVFAFFGSFGLVCYDIDGQPLWQKPLGPFRDEFGSSSSPVLVDGNVILNEDHDLDSFIVALRQQDGQRVWHTPREGFTRSYATPVLWQAGRRTQLVVAGSLQLVAYDPADGRQLWARDGFARIVNTTPAVADGLLFVATWSPGGDSDARIAMEPWDTALAMWDQNKDGQLQSEELPAGEVRSRFFRIDLDSNQALNEAEWNKYARIFELAQNTFVALRPDPTGGPPQLAWEYKRGLPYVASPLVYRGQVILVKDGGVVTVLDTSDGRLVKQLRAGGGGNFYASPAGGDGKIYLASTGGVVTVLAAGESPAVLGSYDFGERIAASPVIAGGRVYVRTDQGLYCFSPP